MGNRSGAIFGFLSDFFNVAQLVSKSNTEHWEQILGSSDFNVSRRTDERESNNINIIIKEKGELNLKYQTTWSQDQRTSHGSRQLSWWPGDSSSEEMRIQLATLVTPGQQQRHDFQ